MLDPGEKWVLLIMQNRHLLYVIFIFACVGGYLFFNKERPPLSFADPSLVKRNVHEESLSPVGSLVMDYNSPYQSNLKNEYQRGENELLTYPNATIQERDFEKGKVFHSSPLRDVSADITGMLSKSELTKEVYEADFDASVIEAFLNSNAEFLSLPVSPQQEVLVSVRKTFDRGVSTVTLFGHSGELDQNETFLVVHDGQLYGTVHEVHPYRAYEYTADGNGGIAIRHLDVEKDIYGQCDKVDAELSNNTLPQLTPSDLLNPVLQGARESLNVGTVVADEGDLISNEIPPMAGISNDGAVTCIDLVVTYLADAASALGGVSATEAKIIGHIDSTTQLFINSGINDTVFQLLGTQLETVATGGIVSPSDPADHNTLQTTLGADISGKINFSGLNQAYTPGGNNTIEGFHVSHSVGVGSGSSFPHEVCHNFGSNHTYGDGGYRNFETDQSFYGWRVLVDGYTYRTVMSYTHPGDIANGAVNGFGPRIGYLSNPDFIYAAPVDNGNTVNVAIGAAPGADASVGATYVCPSLLFGGRAASFTYDDNGTASNYSDDTFTHVGGTGNITNGYNGTHASLGADNHDRVSSRVSLYEALRSRSPYAFLTQPLPSYSSSQELMVNVFSGAQEETSQIDLYQNGIYVQTLETSSPSYSRDFSWSIPEEGLSSGGGYQIYVTGPDNQVHQSASFTLNIINAEPIAYFPMDECDGSELMDRSGEGNNAQLIGGKWQFSTGFKDGCLEIDADDGNANGGFELANVASQITDQVTMMFWCYGDDSLPRSGGGSVFLSGGQQYMTFPWQNGVIYWTAGYGASNTSDTISYTPNSEEYKSQWNHYTFTKNSSTGAMKIYINGQEVASEAGRSLPINGSGTMRFASNGANAYDGYLDEFRIYNLELSQAKISQIYQSYFQEENPLVASYSFEDGSGSVITDGSGNGYDAELLSGVWNSGGGRVGGALEIDADDVNANRGISIPGVAGQITTESTIMLWVYGDASLPRQPGGSVFMTGGGYYMTFPWANGVIYWSMDGDNSSFTPQSSEYKGQWNHYAFVKQVETVNNVTSGTMKIYVNGQERTTQTGVMNPFSDTGTIYIGSGSGSGNNAYDGVIDELKIFKKALNSKTIERIFNEEQGQTMYQAWTDTYQGTVTNVDLTSDEDNDGVPLGIEYVFSGQPDVSDVPVEIETIVDELSVTFSFSRVLESDSCTCQELQYSTDLTNWTGIRLTQYDERVTVQEGVNDLETVSVTIPRDSIPNDSILAARLKVLK